jgi:uncharacterized protein DUF6894
MPRFYFNLTNPDETVRDNIGAILTDASAAHSRALKLAQRVTEFAYFENYRTDFRRWRVQVMDEKQSCIITVPMSTCTVVERQRTLSDFNGARTLQERVLRYYQASDASPQRKGDVANALRLL